MKAIILAGGYATRLHPLTLNQSKPLLHVAGRPIINYAIDKVENLDEVDEIFVVTNEKFASHYQDWVKKYDGSKALTIINDHTTSNDDRLGSVGDIQYVIEQENIEDDILVIGGDNLFEDDLSSIIRSLKERGDTTMLYDVEDIELVKLLSNIVSDENGKMIEYIEKPSDPTSTLCSTLIWGLRKESLPHLQVVIDAGQYDLAGDFIASLCKVRDVYALGMEGVWFDVGTLKQYEEANLFFS